MSISGINSWTALVLTLAVVGIVAVSRSCLATDQYENDCSFANPFNRNNKSTSFQGLFLDQNNSFQADSKGRNFTQISFIGNPTGFGTMLQLALKVCHPR
jgi:hypothetical protein